MTEEQLESSTNNINEIESSSPSSPTLSRTALVLTNQTSSSSNQVEENDGESDGGTTVVYQDDFDLYLLLKDMIKYNPLATIKAAGSSNSLASIITNEQQKRSVVPHRPRRKLTFKGYTKSLIAERLDCHYTDGKQSWEVEENGMVLYRNKVRCIGTQVKDFAFSEPVYLDLQPLSTRIKLMCKMIIIIQGAAVERNGPPKLVQDRSIQAEILPADESDGLKRQNSISKKKSNSCESLVRKLEEEEEVKEQVEESSPGVEIKISIFGNDSKSSDGLKRRLSRKKSLRAKNK